MSSSSFHLFGKGFCFILSMTNIYDKLMDACMLLEFTEVERVNIIKMRPPTMLAASIRS